MKKKYYIFTLTILAIVLSASNVQADGFSVPLATSSINIISLFDHDTPDYTDNSYFVRYDAMVWSDGSASLSICVPGVNCYDGHNGVDFDGSSGDDVTTVADGDAVELYWNSCGGNTLRVWHSNLGYSTFYAHLDSYAVAENDPVVRGQHIADVGSTGSCVVGDHLHFGASDGNSQGSNRMDPYGWTGTTTDPWAYNQGYLWLTDPLSLPEEVSGTISSNTTWSENDHKIINGTLSISSGITLTIEPGVVVKFKTSSSRLSVSGTLDAQGTEVSPIIFTSYKDDNAWGDTNRDATSTTPSAGDWYDITVNTGGVANFEHAIVRYGGNSSGNDANIYNNGGVVAIATSTISHSNEDGVRQGSGTTTISSSIIDSNGIYGVLVLNNNVSVASSTISDNTYGLVTNSGSLSFTDSDFIDNDYAVYIVDPDTLGAHSGNTATSSSAAKNGIYITGSTIDNDATWTADGLPYILAQGTSVGSGVTLTIDPGAVIKIFNNTATFSVGAGGTLNAEGTEANPIYITSYKDDAAGGDTNGDGGSSSPVNGDWRDITINPNGIANFDYTVIRYAGDSFGNDANVYNNGGIVTIASSTFSNSSQYGFYQVSGTTTMLTSIVSNNTFFGFYLSGGTTTISYTEIANNLWGFALDGGTVGAIDYNSFHDNSAYGIRNLSGSSITAENNYWGASDGPSGEGPGSGDAVSTNVDYDPWLTSAP